MTSVTATLSEGVSVTATLSEGVSVVATLLTGEAMTVSPTEVDSVLVATVVVSVMMPPEEGWATIVLFVSFCVIAMVMRRVAQSSRSHKWDDPVKAISIPLHLNNER